jgi:hypothetical protein
MIEVTSAERGTPQWFQEINIRMSGFGFFQGLEAGGIENIGVTPGFQYYYGFSGPVTATAIKNNLALLVDAYRCNQGIYLLPVNVDGAIQVALCKFFL